MQRERKPSDGVVSDSTIPLASRLGELLRQQYAAQACQYRAHDEVHITGADHYRVCSKLAALCLKYRDPVHVVDLGCGAGRHFHCLKNVAFLTAIDVSQEMLNEAKCPVRADILDISCVRYTCADLYTVELPPNEFHLVYCIGVFGNGCALKPPLAQKILASLRPGGTFFFDAYDGSYLPQWQWFKKRIRTNVYDILPELLQARWDRAAGWPPVFLPTRSELERILVNSAFREISIVSEPSHLPGVADGRKFEVTATKPIP